MRDPYAGCDHPVGELSETGVLDVGLKCMHSCTFCYYSHWDGSADQFAGMRRAPWRPRAELEATLRSFRDWGLRRFDVTGGEPTLYPELPELMAWAHGELGLRARITTLGQYLDRRMYRSPTLLIERLHAAGVREFLFSLHAVDAELFRRITGESLEKLQTAIRLAEDLGMTWMTNTVVHAHNATHLPAIARWLAGQNVHLVNFIVMKLEFSWAHARGEAIGRKARYADLLPSLREALGILVAAGRTVNLRYGPYCVYRGLERHLVGFKSVQLDPYEWRNGLRGGADAAAGPYGKPPFLFFERLDNYLREQPHDVETKPGYCHDGYWQCMDTLRDVRALDALCAAGDPPWLRSGASR